MNNPLQLSPTNLAPAVALQPNEAAQPAAQSGTNSPFAQLLQQEQKSEYKEPEKTELAAPSTEATTANITPAPNSQPNAMAKQATREKAKLPKAAPKADASPDASQTVDKASPLERKAKNDADDHERERFAFSSGLSPDPLNPTPTTANTAINLGAKQPICAQGQSDETGEVGSNVLASTQALVSQKSPGERSHPASLLSGKATVGNTLRTTIGNDSESGAPNGANDRGEMNNLSSVSRPEPNGVDPQSTEVFRHFGTLANKDEPPPLGAQKATGDLGVAGHSVSSTAAMGDTTDTAIGNDVKSQIPKAADHRGEANNLPLASYLTPNSIGAQSDVFKQFGLLTEYSLPSKESVPNKLPAVALNDAKSGIPKAADSRSEMNNLFLAAHLAPNAVEPQNTDALKQFGLSKNKEDERSEPVSNTAANSGGISITAPASTQGLEAPLVITITTPAQAPEFKEALALQVSLLAKDGVHEATLQLNPENMGPISVQISTDGTQARVEFAVESSATRDIIEAGMPDLAFALRDAGLTFSGGSVSQNNSQRGDSPPPQPGRSRSSPNEGVEVTPLPQRTLQVRLGGLDLYA